MTGRARARWHSFYIRGRYHQSGNQNRRVRGPDQALAIIDDVVEGNFAAADLATIHGIPQARIRTTLGQVTRAVGSGGGLRSLATGGWYERKSDDQPYDVAPGFAAAWKKARGLS